ncbi:MAG: glycerophosphodiester phosphodiesterase family protein [Candidatus Hydrogenedens sp.]
MNRTHLILFLTLLFLCIYTIVSFGNNDEKLTQDKFCKTKVAAHRGGKALLPENTLYAYQQAVSCWRNFLLEGDVQITADNVAILMHDTTVDRTTNGQGPVKEKTLKEIKELDAGYRFSNDGGQTFPFRGKGITVPTLNEVLEAFPEHMFLFEIKPFTEDLAPIVEPIISRNMQDRVYLASVHPQVIEKIRKEYPQIKTCFTVSDALSFLSALRSKNWSNYTPPAQMLAINEKMAENFKITPEEMKKIKEKGIQILVFTVNKSEDIKKYIFSEVDWILSDYPDRIAQLESECTQN